MRHNQFRRKLVVADTACCVGHVVSFFAACACLVLAETAQAQTCDWIKLVDETSTRISADSSVGVNDIDEKDMATGDLDNDGDTDLVVVRKEPIYAVGGRRNVLFLNEDGVMTDRTADLASRFLDLTIDRDVVIAEVTGDEWLDVITAATFGDPPRVYVNRGVDGAGQWLGLCYDDGEVCFSGEANPPRMPTFSPGPKFCGVAAGDVDGDGDLDLYFSDYDNSLDDRLLINDGAGFFTDETTARMCPGGGSCLNVTGFGTGANIVDVNGDGANDIVRSEAFLISVVYNDPTDPGHFTSKEDIFTDDPYMLTTGDLNNDRRIDIYVVHDTQDIYGLNLGNGPDGKADFTELTVSDSPKTIEIGGNVRAADLDKDGFLDMLVSDVDVDLFGCFRTLAVLQNQGDLQNITLKDPLSSVTRPWNTPGTFDTALLDINGDGWLDLWSGTCTGTQIFITVRPVQVVTSIPDQNETLWRTANNIIRLTFDGDIEAPGSGQLMIQEILSGGAFGSDLSSSFTFVVENDAGGNPRVLRVQESTPTLTHEKWYAVRNGGCWGGVACFTRHFAVLVGDANNDGAVLALDVGLINSGIPTFGAADDDRRDIDGNGHILSADVSVTNAFIPSFGSDKPDGHAVLFSSTPAHDESLWRTASNIVRLTFDGNISAPAAGEIVIQEMLVGGGSGPDLADSFSFTVENDGNGDPRILKILETNSALTHRKWFAFRNTGHWTSVGCFALHYVVQMGDANNDGAVLALDVGLINSGIPTFGAADDDRRDIDGNGHILNADVSVTNAFIPSFVIAKPDGHAGP